MGTERYLTWTTFEHVVDAVAAAHVDGYRVVALELADGAVPLYTLDAGSDVCLAMGNEDHGFSGAALDAFDQVAFIPQLGRVGSLNVATTASIAMYDLRRRSWEALGDEEEPSGPEGVDLDP